MPKHTWIKWFVAYMGIAGGNYMLYSLILPLRIFHHVFLSIILIFWLLKYGLPRSHLLWPLLGVWAAVALSIIGADDKRMALEYGWHWLVNGLLLLIVTDWYRQGREESLLKSQIAVGVFIALTCIGEWLLYGARPGGALFNVNLAGGYLAALIVPLIGQLMTSKNGMQFLKALLFIALLAAAIVVNQSRGALLAVGVSLVAFYLLSHPFRSRVPPVVAVLTVVLVAAGILFYSAQSGHRAGDTDRMDLWRVADELIQTRFFGVGAGLFPQAYAALGRGSEYRFTGAHNYYLNMGAELGAPGLASGYITLLCFLLGLLGRKRSIRQDASLAALFGIAAHMLVDNFPSQGYTFLVSILVAHVLYEWSWGFVLPRKLAFLPVLMIGGALVWFLKLDSAQIAYERSLRDGSYYAAQEAVHLDPDNRLYQIQYIRTGHFGDLSAAYPLAPGLARAADLATYGLVNYGRVFQ